MSIYVELLERVEKEGEFSTSKKKKVHDKASHHVERQRTEEAPDALGLHGKAETGLPHTEQQWDEILAGRSTVERDRKTEREKYGPPETETFEPSMSEGPGTQPRPLDEPRLGEATDSSNLVGDEVDDKPSPAEYLVRNMGDREGGERVIRGKVNESEHSILPARILIPLRKLRSMGMVTPDMEHKGIVEEYRHLKRILLRNIRRGGEEMGVGVAVTSALPDEGKTFTALNLAMSFSLEKSRTVLLVDADLERGGASSFLEARNEKGLKDYLEDPSLSVDDIVYDTDLPNIKVIPVGRKQSATAELFSSDRMENLVREVSHSDDYQLVIFDSSPVLVSSAANILSGLVDQTLVVVRANQTPGNMIREVEETLVDSKQIGFVLNRVPYSEKKHNIYYAENDAAA